MPTQLPPAEKSAFIALVTGAPSPGGPQEAARLQVILNYCEDVAYAFARQMSLYAANNAYLVECLNVFSTETLALAKIIYNVNDPTGTTTDPLIVANSVLGDIVLSPNTSSPFVGKGLIIWGSSVIHSISPQYGTIVDNLYIGPGAVVDIYNGAPISSPPASPPKQTAVDVLYMPNLRSQPATLNMATYGSVINQPIIADGSYYGGIQGYDPELTCNIPVTLLNASNPTGTSYLISWTPPASGYLFIEVYYRLHGSKPWIKVAPDNGDYIGNIGFIFRNLDRDTYYDVRVTVICNNGGHADNEITIQTLCCGGGLPTWKTCPLSIIIGTDPVSPPQGITLCDGGNILLYYPPGTTLTIPYLATVFATPGDLFTVDNSPYQNIPYDKDTATWNFVGTDLGQLITGNKVSTMVTLKVA